MKMVALPLALFAGLSVMSMGARSVRSIVHPVILTGPTSLQAGETATYTVQMDGTATDATVVQLTSSLPGAVSVPAGVTVPVGSDQASFSVTASSSASAGTVTLSAAANGSTVSTSLLVRRVKGG